MMLDDAVTAMWMIRVSVYTVSRTKAKLARQPWLITTSYLKSLVEVNSSNYKLGRDRLK